MSFFNFGSKPAAPATPSASGAQPGVASPATQAVQDGKMPGTDQLPANPLDVYAKLWENSDKAPEVAPSFTLDPKVLDEVSGTLDFTKGIDQTLVAKATSGDTSALLQLMNLVGQQSYKAALAHGSGLTDKFVNARSQYDLKGIGSQVKSELTADAMSSIPNYSHPAVKAEVTRIARAMQQQNPEASPAEIADATKTYFSTVYAAINPADPTSSQQQQGEEDWDKFFK